MGAYMSRRQSPPLLSEVSAVTQQTERVLNWKPDPPTEHDEPELKYDGVGLRQSHEEVATAVTLRSRMPPVYDQGALGSCTANALAGAYEYDASLMTGHVFVPSRLFIYYNERKREDTVDQDSGACLRDGVQSLAQQGVCAESEWPYDTAKFEDRPPESCYAAAEEHMLVAYRRLPSALDVVNGVRHALIRGYPVVFGVQVYRGFMDAPGGRVPMPDDDDPTACLGGHAILAVGYDDGKSEIVFRNSWGVGWGDVGYGSLTYEYVRKYGSSFWVLTSVDDE